jgi:hypothetical protein
MVSSAITNTFMSGVPKSQAGVASGMNSASRQLGTSLGVAIVGSVLASSLRGSMHAGFLSAAHPGWWVMAGCGYTVLLLGVVSTTRWARATVRYVRSADEDETAYRADVAPPGTGARAQIAAPRARGGRAAITAPAVRDGSAAAAGPAAAAATARGH